VPLPLLRRPRGDPICARTRPPAPDVGRPLYTSRRPAMPTRYPEPRPCTAAGCRSCPPTNRRRRPVARTALQTGVIASSTGYCRPTASQNRRSAATPGSAAHKTCVISRTCIPSRPRGRSGPGPWPDPASSTPQTPRRPKPGAAPPPRPAAGPAPAHREADGPQITPVPPPPRVAVAKVNQPSPITGKTPPRTGPRTC